MSPANAGTRVFRIVDAMQPQVGVAWKGGPEMFAVVTRPVCENVMVTIATPLGSPSLRQPEACPADASSALRADATSKGSVPAAPRGSMTVGVADVDAGFAVLVVATLSVGVAGASDLVFGVFGVVA